MNNMNNNNNNQLNNEMLSGLINNNQDVFNRAQQMCAGKSPDELKQLAMNLLQSQGRNVSELTNLASVLGLRL